MRRLANFLSAAALALTFMLLPAQVFAQDGLPALLLDEDVPLDLPELKNFAPVQENSGRDAMFHTVRLDAVLVPEGEPLQHGLVWRVFHPIPDHDGKLPLLASAEGGSAAFQFEPGDYFVHVAFGKAGVTKKLTVLANGPTPKQTLILDAGGLVLSAVSGSDVRIPPEKLRFSIYGEEENSEGERQLVVSGVLPNTMVRLNAGTYHVVSDYGSVNAVIRADIRVEAGKLTEATIQHRAAQLTLKLVSNEGGEAIADTAWSILTSSGDLVSESVGAFPSLVLAEGEYTAIARNKEKIYQRDFQVVAGRNQDIEVLLQ